MLKTDSSKPGWFTLFAAQTVSGFDTLLMLLTAGINKITKISDCAVGGLVGEMLKTDCSKPGWFKVCSTDCRFDI